MRSIQKVPVQFHLNPDNPMALLRACSAYCKTPLIKIVGLRSHRILIKDETHRMNLGSFKALGGVYAVAKLLAEQWEAGGRGKLEPEDFLNAEVKNFAQSITYVCASAGNHGLAVAAGAKLFGAQSRVYISQEVPGSFESRLNDQGAEVIRAGMTYEESVAAAIEDAALTGAVHLADGSWENYTQAPRLVMEGYTVVAEELREEFESKNEWPTHVYLQAGVGGLAGAIAYMIRKNWSVQPLIIIVEPNSAPCLKASNDAGRCVRVEGIVSNMGRLDCKEPSMIAHSILQLSNVEFITISDDDAIAATNYLDKQGIPTTPSGAAGYAGLSKLLSLQSQVAGFLPLVIVTEGAL
ncbi:MAG: PLP-dependent lyase/thiolase [SAR86 cluster bacterium]|uniref:PLP-dependent lyase/thiolase n=1 Tax=SAR86 cluster bacterium TaxID=2030880 RepID=A0A2A4XA79_9GAMM|nr:MAG: PLP-dependent lyase/thiolase [SAR86 cluster bacterium]